MTRTARPIVLAEQAAPATPSSGFGAIYFKTDGTLYYKNDAGTEVPLSSLASSMVRVVHGATAATARPTGVGQVMWEGSVRPTNAAAGDLLMWVTTAVSPPQSISLWRRGPSNINEWTHLGGGQMGQGNVEPDPSFETNSLTGLGWNGFLNCTPAIQSTVARTGTYALGVTKDGTPASMQVGKFNSATYFLPVVEGDSVVASAWSRPAVTARQFQVSIGFLTLINDFTSTQAWQEPPVTEVVGQWVYGEAAGICPAGCAYARVQYTWLSVAASEVHYLDDIRFERGLTPTDPVSARQTLVGVGTPADAAVLPGTGEVYLDTTTGAPKVKAKVKDNAGTTFNLDLSGINTGSFPILAPNGSAAAPSYAFTADPDTGIFSNGVGDIRMLAAGSVGSFGAAVTVADDGTNGTTSLFCRGTGSVRALVGAFTKLTIVNANATLTIPLIYTEAAAPATPGAGLVVTYAKADGLMYSKDDAGVETLMSSGAGGGGVTYPLLAPNGLVTAPSYAFTNDVDAGLFLNVPGDVRVTVGGAAKFIGNDDGTNGSCYIDARGTGMTVFRHGGVNKMFVLADRISFGGVPASLGEITPPSTPPAAEIYIYGKTDKKLYAKDSAGLETLLSSDTDDIEFMAMWGAFA